MKPLRVRGEKVLRIWNNSVLLRKELRISSKIVGVEIFETDTVDSKIRFVRSTIIQDDSLGKGPKLKIINHAVI
jgi:hypothetical protein